MARIWNKYPYTDLHELNLSWVIDKVAEFGARLDTVEEDVASLKARATALETRVSAAENKITQHTAQISTLEASSTAQDARLQTLENADIQDAAMLESVSSVNASVSAVTVNFSAAAYTDGAKTAGTDSAVIPAATSSAAGVMLPGEKAKLAPITVDGSNVSFAGTVAGSTPVQNNDYATKQYVDNIVISGGATVTSQALSPASDYGTPSYGVNSFMIYRFGAFRIFTGQCSMLHPTSDIPNNRIAFYVDLPSGDLPPSNIFTCWVKDADGLYSFHAIVSRTDGGIYIRNISNAAIPAASGFSNVNVTISWIVV